MTAKQVIMQRLRDAEHDNTYGEYSGHEGDIVTGIIQADAQATQRGLVLVSLGKVEAVLPPSEQVPGEVYDHGTRIKCYVVSVVRGHAWPADHAEPDPPQPGQEALRPRGARDRRRHVEIMAVARESGHRTKIAVRSTVDGLNAKGACIGPMGQRVRNVVAELHGEKIDIIDYDDDPATFVGNALSPATRPRGHGGRPGGQGGPGRRARLPAVAGDRPGGPERPAGGAADRLADRHPLRRRAGAGAGARPATRHRRWDTGAGVDDRATESAGGQSGAGEG